MWWNKKAVLIALSCSVEGTWDDTEEGEIKGVKTNQSGNADAGLGNRLMVEPSQDAQSHLQTRGGKKLAYKLHRRKTVKEPEFIITSVEEESSSQHLESLMEGFSNLTIPDDVMTYNFSNISIKGLDSPIRSGDNIPSTSKEQNTHISKVASTGPSRGQYNAHNHVHFITQFPSIFYLMVTYTLLFDLQVLCLNLMSSIA